MIVVVECDDDGGEGGTVNGIGMSVRLLVVVLGEEIGGIGMGVKTCVEAGIKFGSLEPGLLAEG